MDASIVIPTYNRLRLVQRTLHSLSRLTYPQNGFEVIVVDDGSGDGTAEWIRAQTWPFSLRCVRHEANAFAAAARNTGIKAARGEVIVFLDDDMEVEPGFLQEHIRLHQGPEQMAVVGNILAGPDAPATGMVKYLSTRGVHKLEPGQAMPFRYWCSGNASVRRSVLVEAGMFDENIRQYGGEDLELAFRLHKTGVVRFCYAARATSYHLHHRDPQDVCRMMYIYGQTSLAYMIRIHPDLAPHVKADLIEPLRFGQDPVARLASKLFIRAAMNSALCRLARWYAAKSRSGKPSWLFDYVIACHYLRGLLRQRQISDNGASEGME